MLVTILKPFPYAEDGIDARDLKAGAVEEIVDACVPGLVAERYVALFAETAPAPAVLETKIIEAAPEAGAAEALVGVALPELLPPPVAAKPRAKKAKA